MTHVDTIERMLSELRHAPMGDRVYSSSALKNVDPAHTIECVFDFEPRLRYARYISSFNRIIDTYTCFAFDVASMRRPHLRVTYYAKYFDLTEKNVVRSQLLKLINEHDLCKEFSIRECTLFENHAYPHQDEKN